MGAPRGAGRPRKEGAYDLTSLVSRSTRVLVIRKGTRIDNRKYGGTAQQRYLYRIQIGDPARTALPDLLNQVHQLIAGVNAAQINGPSRVDRP